MMKIDPIELATAAAAAWGSSNPPKDAREHADRIEGSLRDAKDRLTADVIEIKNTLAVLPGIIDDPDDTESAHAHPTSPASMSVEVRPGDYQIAGDIHHAESAIVLIPRPGDGVVREVLGTVAEGLVGQVAAITFQTGGQITAAPAPVIEGRRQGTGVHTVLVAATDYTINLVTGEISIIAGAPNLLPGDQIEFTGSWVGSWTASVVFLPGGIVEARRGLTGSPTRTWGDSSRSILQQAQVCAIGPISDATTSITAGMIQNQRSDYFGVLGILRKFEATTGHRHRKGVEFDGGIVPRPRGRTIVVDPTFGEDATALREDLSFPFATIPAALSAAQAGDLIELTPGNHDVTTDLVLPANVSIGARSLAVTKIRRLGITSAAVGITMGENSRFEDLTLEMTSSQHVNLTGIKFGGTTSATAKVRTSVITIDNSGAGVGSSDVVGILVQSTGAPGRETNAVRATTSRVTSTSSGKKRGILMNTSAGSFFIRDVQLRAIGGTDSIGAEVDFAGATLGYDSGTCQGDTADWSQTAGTLRVSSPTSVNSNANGKGFTADATSVPYIFGDPGSLPGNSTRYFYSGTESSTTNEIKLRMPRNSILKSMTVRCRTAPGVGKTDIFTVRRNGSPTVMTISLTGINLFAETTNLSQQFLAGDDLSIQVATDIATGTDDVQIILEFY